MTQTYVRPFLKWAGGKYQVLQYILPILPAAKRLIEPFVGSGTVFLNTDYPKYLLADNNQDLINLYQQLQNEGEGFIEYCQEFFQQTNNVKEKYYEWRTLFNTTTDTRLKSALFIYLNRHSYNGLCRYNPHGKFNVPFGTYKNTYLQRDKMEYFLEKAEQVKFIQGDFTKTMSLAKKGDVIYCDPPYVPLSSTANFTEYGSAAFGKAQQLELAHLANRLAANGIPVIISNHDTEFTRKAYKKAHIIKFNIQRHISRQGSNRQKVGEILAVFK